MSGGRAPGSALGRVVEECALLHRIGIPLRCGFKTSGAGREKNAS